MGYRAWMVNIELMRRGTEDNQAGKGASVTEALGIEPT
jgi:hypothetical protein